jgi:uncharacterized protein (TIGR00255 family)
MAREVRSKVTEELTPQRLAGETVTRSMTGFSSAIGRHDGWSWSVELRSVNGRGLDLKLRVPDWIEGLEPALRTLLQARVSRGAITVSLRLAQDIGGETAQLNADGLARALDLVRRVEAGAGTAGVELAPATALDVLALRGVMETAREDQDAAALRDAILATVPALLDAFDAMRAAEGAHLGQRLLDQVDEVARLVAEARSFEPERTARSRAALAESLARVMEGAAGADPGRVAQELALLAVKSDVTEELDRLDAHVAAARALLAEDGAKGRKLDFLTQEFNREANTLCAKSQFAPLTRIGLDLKHVIDQMREQVQNVE